MRRNGMVLAAVMGVVSVVGCTGGSGGGPSASLQDLSNRLTAVRQGTVSHGSQVGATTSLAQVRTLESQYASWMAGQYGAMGQDMAEMTAACGMQAMSGLADAFYGMEEECLAHQATMDSAGTMGMAGDEEATHQQMMLAMLDSMGTMSAAMTSMMGGCGGGHMMGGPGGMM